MTSFRDAANGLADAFEAGIAHTHPEAVTREEFDALVERTEARLKKLEDGGVVIPEPEEPPTGDPDKPWERYFPAPLGFAQNGPRCTEQHVVTGGSASQIASMRDALRAGGVAVLVEDRVAFDFAGSDLYLNAPDTALIGLGAGFQYQGAPIRVMNAARILVRNCEQGTVPSGDGLKIQEPGATDVRIDAWTGGYAGDEMLDIWDGARDVTLSRLLFPDMSKVDYGLIIGSAPSDTIARHTRVTVYECVSYTEQRFPILAHGSAHMVNNVKPRWAHAALQAQFGAKIDSERNWYGPSAGRPQNLFLNQDGTATFTSSGDVFDAVPVPKFGGTPFPKTYGEIGTAMNAARRAEVLGLAGRGRVIVE